MTDVNIYDGFHTLQWHITHRCNLRCSHCYQDDYSHIMSKDKLFGVLDKYERFLKTHHYYGQINITGGEPLSSPDFFPLVEEIRHRGIRFAVLTNGTLITPDIAGMLARLRPVFVQISLDGCESTHDAIRGIGNFRRALDGIDFLKSEGVRVLVSFTLQRTNMGEFRPLARICRAHGVDKLWWDRVVIPAAEDTEQLSVSTEQFEKFVRLSGRLYRRNMRLHGNSVVQPVRSLQFLGCEDFGVYRCSAGMNLAVILADGAVMPCRRLPFVIGNILENELDEIIARSEIMHELSDAGVPKDCLSCPHSELCAGGAKCVTYAKTGSFTCRDVNCFVTTVGKYDAESSIR